MITIEQSKTATHFHHVSLKNKDGSPLRARRNGKTKTWKKLPNEFKIPIKIGMYEYGYIDKANFMDWNVVT